MQTLGALGRSRDGWQGLYKPLKCTYYFCMSVQISGRGDKTFLRWSERPAHLKGQETLPQAEEVLSRLPGQYSPSKEHIGNP